MKREKNPANHTAHLPVAEMVLEASKTLMEWNGFSLQVTKKYVGTNYKCDVAKHPEGSGKESSPGSFKLAVKEAAWKKAVKKPAAAKKTTTAAKNSAGEKMTAAAKTIKEGWCLEEGKGCHSEEAESHQAVEGRGQEAQDPEA